METTQKQNAIEAREAESKVLLIELDENQKRALSTLGLEVEDANKIASAAFNSSLKGKVGAVRDRAIKAKYLAMSKNKAALADECEKEIQQAIRLYKSLE